MDLAILNFIQTLRTPFFDVLVPIITKLGDAGLIWIVLFALMLTKKQTRFFGILGLLALLLELVIVSGIMKPLIMRERPFITYAKDILIAPPLGSSFPSGHSGSSFAAAGILFFMKFKGRYVALFLALCIAVSRLYLFVHYPSDVFVGSCIGMAIAYTVYRFAPKIQAKLLDHNFPIEKTL